MSELKTVSYRQRLRLIKKGNETWAFLYPPFVHDFGEDNDSENPADHVFKGSFVRHRAVEKPLLKIRWLLMSFDAVPGYTPADGLLGILLGLNCNFPMRDVALWFVWFLRGGKAQKFCEGEE